MSLRPVSWFRVVLPLMAVAVASCSSHSEPEKPGFFKGASVTIRGAGAMEVQDALVETFLDHEFRLASGIGNHMTFEKPGSRNDRWMYGSYGSGPETQRLEVMLEIGDDPETIVVVCSGKVVRELGRGMGEDTGRLFARGRWRYDDIVEEAKKRVERESLRR